MGRNWWKIVERSTVFVHDKYGDRVGETRDKHLCRAQATPTRPYARKGETLVARKSYMRMKGLTTGCTTPVIVDSEYCMLDANDFSCQRQRKPQVTQSSQPQPIIKRGCAAIRRTGTELQAFFHSCCQDWIVICAPTCHVVALRLFRTFSSESSLRVHRSKHRI
jgi:hypothetical protein